MRYSEQVLDHFFHPRRVGELPAQPGVFTSQMGSQAQGKQLQLQVKIDEQDIVRDARFKAYGDPALIAAASLLMELCINQPLTRLQQYDADFLLAKLALPAVKRHAVLLVERAIVGLLKQIEGK